MNIRCLLVEEGGFLYGSDAYNDELPYWSRWWASRTRSCRTRCDYDGKFARGAFATANDWFAFMRDAFDSCTRRGRVSRE